MRKKGVIARHHHQASTLRTEQGDIALWSTRGLRTLEKDERGNFVPSIYIEED